MLQEDEPAGSGRKFSSGVDVPGGGLLQDHLAGTRGAKSGADLAVQTEDALDPRAGSFILVALLIVNQMQMGMGLIYFIS